MGRATSKTAESAAQQEKFQMYSGDPITTHKFRQDITRQMLGFL
jgi:hypothetical protein